MMRRIGILLLAISLCSCKTAEFGFRMLDANGMVYDFDNRPIPNYKVTIGGKSVRTDITGRFTIQKLPLGDNTVLGDKEGFEPYVGSVDIEDSKQVIYFRVPSSRQLLQLADDTLSKGKMDESLNLVERALKINGDNQDALFFLAIIQYKKGNVAEAQMTLRSLIDSGKQDPYVEKFLDYLEKQG